MASLVFIHASDGNNALLAKEVETRAVEMGHEVEHVSLNAFDFPVYTVAREQSTPILEGLDELKTILDKGDAWFVFAPEYNGSYPPVLNNAIAWLSRDGDDFRRLFRDRTVALGTHSGGGGQHVIMAMRMQFSFLGCVVIGRSLVTNRKKPANPESIDAILNAMTKR
ncbi:MAG: NADPH-dependent oxidoreductase [Verrucomicrobiales bacterium]|nr:NADPH-dependent oxidoreductase [Verrucomicrobiales bacterium]|tara:strand:- start:3112 stop:3612 length:501 start_codon:yes stop_codon:yes gene_type:complete